MADCPSNTCAHDRVLVEIAAATADRQVPVYFTVLRSAALPTPILLYLLAYRHWLSAMTLKPVCLLESEEFRREHETLFAGLPLHLHLVLEALTMRTLGIIHHKFLSACLLASFLQNPCTRKFGFEMQLRTMNLYEEQKKTKGEIPPSYPVRS